MKIILFLSHCCVINNEQWSFRVFQFFTRWDWFRSSIKLHFYHSSCLKFNAELFLFVIFSTFSFVLVQLSFIYRQSLRSLRNHFFTLLLFNTIIVENRIRMNLITSKEIISSIWKNPKTSSEKVTDKLNDESRECADFVFIKYLIFHS